MTIFGTVQNGRVVPDDASALSDGQRVRIELVVQQDRTGAQGPERNGAESERKPAWIEKSTALLGSIDGPSDLAEQHGHYAHGQPKSQS